MTRGFELDTWDGSASSFTTVSFTLPVGQGETPVDHVEMACVCAFDNAYVVLTGGRLDDSTTIFYEKTYIFDIAAG